MKQSSLLECIFFSYELQKKCLSIFNLNISNESYNTPHQELAGISMKPSFRWLLLVVALVVFVGCSTNTATTQATTDATKTEVAQTETTTETATSFFLLLAVPFLFIFGEVLSPFTNSRFMHCILFEINMLLNLFKRKERKA